MSSNLQLVAQAVSLLLTFAWTSIRIITYIPYALLRISLRSITSKFFPSSLSPSSSLSGNALFYTGIVFHSRKRPKENTFTYPVRMPIINLDSPPPWFSPGDGDTLTAAAARSIACTAGPVLVLTHPPSAGYTQNPISVYYCYGADVNNIRENGLLSAATPPPPPPQRCIAEVTNTPWGERVTFVFNPALPGDAVGSEGERVPKALHVSPLMDMQNVWTVKAPPPTAARLFLSVSATHPELGDYFVASLDAKRDVSAPDVPNEVASLRTLVLYGFQPQRVAVWIYWQAVRLLWKGVSFFPPPGSEFRGKLAVERGEMVKHHPMCCGGGGGKESFLWRDAQGWPWR